ncbi:MAG: hypothetical protein GC136_09395 [Alphaproteobacteria bacterium]|nr:hypothetical protein [Alphaproteobacteria bacterium]
MTQYLGWAKLAFQRASERIEKADIEFWGPVMDQMLIAEEYLGKHYHVLSGQQVPVQSVGMHYPIPEEGYMEAFGIDKKAFAEQSLMCMMNAARYYFEVARDEPERNFAQDMFNKAADYVQRAQEKYGLDAATAYERAGGSAEEFARVKQAFTPS